MKKGLALFLALVILFAPWQAFAQQQTDTTQMLREAAEGLRSLLQVNHPLSEEELLPAGDASGDWTALVFALAGERADYKAYGKRLESYVTQTYEQRGSLGAYSATHGQRIVLTAAALGLDPTAFGGSIDLVADSTYDYRQGDEEIFDQGLNACIFALLALDCKNYPVPQGSRYTRESLLSYLLSRQNDDGGFGLTEGDADADVTAMAVQALAAYTEDEAVNAAAQRALDWLSGQQSADGQFPSRSSETVAQTIIAVTALGLDPMTEPRFIQNGVTLLAALEVYRQPDGSFAHSADEAGNVMATQQAMLALLAMKKQKDGVRLYDFSALPAPNQSKQMWIWFLVPAGTIGLFVIVLFTIRRKKKDG